MTLILWRDVWFSSAAVLLGPRLAALRMASAPYVVRSQSREFAFNLLTCLVLTCFGEFILNGYQPLGRKFPADSTTKNASFILFHLAERFGSSSFWCRVCSGAKDIPHEVLVTNRKRFAVSLWLPGPAGPGDDAT